MKNTCCFTGHRRLPADKIEYIVKRLDNEIDILINQGVTEFISGGAVGFDLIAASLVAAKKEMGQDIKLIFALPCKNQDANWGDKNKKLYRNLLNDADEIVYVSEEYHKMCMEQRNQYMVLHSAHCICALLRERSGTGQTVRMARREGLNVVNTAV